MNKPVLPCPIPKCEMVWDHIHNGRLWTPRETPPEPRSHIPWLWTRARRFPARITGGVAR